MKQILIACAMMEDELNKVYEEINCSIPIIWMDRGYHSNPANLKKKLQDLINEHQDMDQILLLFGLCGNGTDGIVSEKTMLIMPKFDDCLNMMLCRGERQSRGLVKAGSIYLTRGWTMDSETILGQYNKYMEEYDEETALEIFEMMYEHYEKIAVIDTGSYELASVLDYAKTAAGLLDLSIETVEGSTEIIKQLLTGQWDENFIIKNPGEPIQMSSFEV